MNGSKKLIYGWVALVVPFGTLGAQTVEDSTVEEARTVLSEVMAIPAKAIPHSLLAEAYGVAILPAMISGQSSA